MALQEQLRELFQFDQQVRGLRSRLDGALRRLKVQQTKYDQLQRQHDELADQLRQVKAAAANFELDSKQTEARIVKLREQMNSVTSNKEYSALLVEVNTLKIEKSKSEDQSLEQLARVDLLEEELKEISAKSDEQAKLVSAAESEVKASREDVGARLDEVSAQREQAASVLPDDVRQTFERLSVAHEGEAMAGVVEENRRAMEYTCGGCYMTIPAERVNALMTRPDTIILCPSCGRMLYLDQQLKASMTGAK